MKRVLCCGVMVSMFISQKNSYMSEFDSHLRISYFGLVPDLTKLKISIMMQK